MAYHPQLRQLVFFGGKGREWSWNGSTWKKLVASGSPNDAGLLLPRPWLNDVVLIGGSADWAWNGTTWAKAQRAGPRFGPFRGTAVALVNDKAILRFRPLPDGAEDWMQDSAGAWSRVARREVPSSTHAIAYDVDRDRTLAIAPGRPAGKTTPMKVWELVESHWRPRTTTGHGPTGKDFGRAVYHRRAKALFYYSGISGSWMLKNFTWSRVSKDVSPGFAGALIYDEHRGIVIAQTTCSSGWWEWSRTSGWRRPSQLGPTRSRCAFAIAYHPVLRLSLLLGGRDPLNNRAFNDCWSWDGKTWKALGLPVRTDPIWGARMTFFSALNTIVVHGGHTLQGQVTRPSLKNWALTSNGFIPIPAGHTRHGAFGSESKLVDESRRSRLRAFHPSHLASDSWHWQLALNRLTCAKQMTRGGGSSTLRFNAPSARLGIAIYLLSTGTHPGVVLAQNAPLIPLRADPLLASSIGRNVRLIDKSGLSGRVLAWPRLPGLAGLRVHVAALGLSRANAFVMSNQVQIDFAR